MFFFCYNTLLSVSFVVKYGSYLPMGWARTVGGRSSGTWGCTVPGSTRAAPSAPRRSSSYPASTSHMTPKGRPPTSTPWRVSGTDGRKSWRILSYFRGWQRDALPRPPSLPGDDRLMPVNRDVTGHALAPPFTPALDRLYAFRPSHACLRRRRRPCELLNYLIGSFISVALPFHASNSAKVDA